MGEVRDEHVPVQEILFSDTDGAWDLEASLRPDEASEHLDMLVPEHEEYDTLAGLVTLELGRLARVGDSIEIASEPVPGMPPSRIEFTVTAMDDHRIDRVRVLVHTVEHDETDADADPVLTTSGTGHR